MGVAKELRAIATDLNEAADAVDAGVGQDRALRSAIGRLVQCVEDHAKEATDEQS